MLASAWKHFNEGRFEEAGRICSQVLEAEPENADAWQLQAMAALRLGRFDEAESNFQRAIRARPDFLDAHSNRGIALAIQGRAEEALACFQRAHAINPKLADVHNNLGCALRDLGRHEEALERFRTAVNLNPDHTAALQSLVHFLFGQKRYRELTEILRQVVWLRSDRALLWCHLGDALAMQKEYAEAVDCWRAAIRLDPDSPEAHNGLGIALAGLENFDEALAHYRRSLELKPDQADVYNNLGSALRGQGRIDEALLAHDRALSLKPDDADTHNNRGLAFEFLGRRDLALECLEQALAVAPEHVEARKNRSFLWLAQGDFERGWPEYEWRWKNDELTMPPHPQPLWAGEPLGGRTILLHAEQGLGDTLQFIRYAPGVKERGGRVIVECQRPLLRLLESCPGIDRLIARGDPLPGFDVHAPLMSLPHLFKTTLETIPANVPYLTAEAALVGRWQGVLERAPGFRIGIAWNGNPKHGRNRYRSFPLDLFERIARIEGVRLFSLQKGEGSEQARQLEGRFSVRDLSAELDQGPAAFVDTAAVMTSLDLVITPDTSLAHLAGALGVPVFIALALAADFRWLLEREDSPWYPTVRLFRQRKLGEWDDVFDRMALAVARAASGHRRPGSADVGISAGGQREGIKILESLNNMLASAWKCFNLGKFDEASRIARQVVATDPEDADAWHLLAMANLRLGRFDLAESSFLRAIAARPDFLEAHSNLGIALAQTGRLEEALVRFQRAFAINPNLADVHNNLGCALRDLGRRDEAVASFRTAVGINPDHAGALGSLMQLLEKQRAEVTLKGLSLAQDDADLEVDRGNALSGQDRLEQALLAYERAIKLEPDHADAWHNRGTALEKLGRYEEALACMDQAIRLVGDHGDAHRNRSVIWLIQGDFARGWPEYEWRWKCREGPTMSQYPAPQWAGEPLQGRAILLHAEQGLGDTLQFVRYAQHVHGLGGRVIVACQRPLIRLLETCAGIDQLVAQGDPLPAFDVHAPLLSLPYLLKTTLETIPAEIPYLWAEPTLVARWRTRLGPPGRFNVGVAWSGSPKNARDRYRSFPLARFEKIAGIEGVRLISLQKGPGSEQVRDLEGRFPVLDLSGELDQGPAAFVETAAVLMSLDLVITPCTALAHLAGSLGVPVWIPLTLAPDFRWLLEREDSPWYPTARLFRQKSRGDWEDVFERMASALAPLASGPRPAGPIEVQISPGELIDKITILRIKRERISDKAKLANVVSELEMLEASCDQAIAPSHELTGLTDELRGVNEALWEVEDELRECEHAGEFGPRFIELARSVYRLNDRRAAIKRQINESLGSRLVEEKSYAGTGGDGGAQ